MVDGKKEDKIITALKFLFHESSCHRSHWFYHVPSECINIQKNMAAMLAMVPPTLGFSYRKNQRCLQDLVRKVKIAPMQYDQSLLDQPDKKILSIERRPDANGHTASSSIQPQFCESFPQALGGPDYSSYFYTSH